MFGCSLPTGDALTWVAAFLIAPMWKAFTGLLTELFSKTSLQIIHGQAKDQP